MTNHRGQMIADRRAQNGLSQADLAALVGEVQQTVSAWETGTRVPSMAQARWIAHVLLLGESEIAVLFGLDTNNEG